MKRYACRWWQALIFAAVAGQTNAQTVVVSFSPAEPSQVPLSPWAMAILVVTLLFAARKVFGRLSGKAAAWLVLVGGLLLAPSTNWVNEARAVGGVTTFDLVWPSPMESPTLAWARDIAVVNRTGQTIRIDLVDEPRGALHWINIWPPRATPACAPGLIVSPAGVCYVWVEPAA